MEAHYESYFLLERMLVDEMERLDVSSNREMLAKISQMWNKYYINDNLTFFSTFGELIIVECGVL